MRKLIHAIAIVGIFSLSGCALQQMVKKAQEQNLTVTPNPLEVHDDSVAFEMSATLPVKMLKKGKVYTVKTYYTYGDGQEIELGDIEFRADDYPNANETNPRASNSYGFAYMPEYDPGQVVVQGIASDPKNGKSESTDRMPVAPGLITTSQLVEEVYFPAFADHGYNTGEELIPSHVNFYFLQGSPVLRRSEVRSERGEFLQNFIAEKNVTRTVSITGAHSPEGPERINANLANERAEAIEEFYRDEMDKYDYMGMADSIEFILKPVVEDWTMFKEKLADYDGISEDQKAAMLDIVNGAGTFEEKEDELHKLEGYDDVFDDIYPELRVAKTEILTVKEKKSPAEISALASAIVDGDVPADTLSDEEMAYAATLTPSMSEKAEIYEALIDKSNSAVAHTNLGAVHLAMAAQATSESEMNDHVSQAITHLETGMNMEETAAGYINMGSAYAMQGNTDKAYDMVKKGLSMNPSAENAEGAQAVKGMLEIQSAEYSSAVSSLNNAEATTDNMYNKGLAQVLAGDYQNAITTFNEVTDMDSNYAMAYYGAAVASAHLDNDQEVFNYLESAIQADPDLAAYAVDDLEFQKYYANAAFQEALK